MLTLVLVPVIVDDLRHRRIAWRPSDRAVRLSVLVLRHGPSFSPGADKPSRVVRACVLFECVARVMGAYKVSMYHHVDTGDGRGERTTPTATIISRSAISRRS